MREQQNDHVNRSLAEHRGGGAINDRQSEAIHTLSADIAYKGKSRIATLRALPNDRKWSYFRDELLARTVAIIAAVVVIVYLAVQILTPQAAPQLTVAVTKSALGTSDGAALQTQVAQALKLPEGREGGVTIDTGYDLTDNNSLTKLQTRLSAHELDIIIASPDDFTKLAGFGYFQTINDALTSEQQRNLSGSFVSFHGFDDSDGTDIDYDGSGKGASVPYGLQLASAKQWTALHSADKDALAGVVLESKNANNAQKFVDWMTS